MAAFTEIKLRVVGLDLWEAVNDKAEFADEYAAQLEDSKHRVKWLQDYANKLVSILREDGEWAMAAREAVAVLEDMYAQRGAETESWFQKWMGEFSDHHKTKAALKDAEAKIAELLRLTLAYYRQ